MATRKTISAFFTAAIIWMGGTAHSESSQVNYRPNYQKATCSDKTVRYCVKAKATKNLWWIAFDPDKSLPVGAEHPGNVKCDKATVGTDLKGAFTPTPTIKCVMDQANLA